jgi:sugar lactone lactonase YvrE
MRKAAFLLVVLSLSAVATCGEEVKFASRPTAKKAGEKVTITFSVTGPTDVSVAIVDAEGEVVRHLAAGVLGSKAPEPLKAGLVQTLVWDGKDDAGRQILSGRSDSKGPFKVRVRLGLKPAFDRILGWRGEALGSSENHNTGIVGMAVDAAGRCYALQSGSKKPTNMYVLDRSGKYLKSILPYPANLPREKVGGLGLLEISAGRCVPIIRHPISFAIYPGCYGMMHGINGVPAQTMALVGDRVVFVNAWTSRYGGAPAGGIGPRRLLIIGTDGSVPENYMGPLLSEERTEGFVHLVAAGDGKSVFATGLRGRHAVYKVRLDEKGPAEAFLGTPGAPGGGKTGFKGPRGLAGDRHGNLYVSDHGNNRIAVFKQDGSYLGQVAAQAPGPLAVHQRSDAIYYLTVQREHPTNVWCSQLTKLSPVVDAGGRWKGGGKTQGSMKWGGYGWQSFAVDGHADPAVVWIGRKVGTPSLLRLEETGGTFGRPKSLFSESEPVLRWGGFLAVDRRSDEVYTRTVVTSSGKTGWIRIDGRTGEAARIKIPGSDIAVGPEGNVYVLDRNTIRRFDRTGKPVPFAASGETIGGTTVRPYPRGPIHGARGHCVGFDGRIYLMNSDANSPKHTLLDVYGADGKPLAKGVLARNDVGSAGIQVDARGNLYVTSSIKPADRIVPPELEGQVPAGRKWKHGFNWYPWLYGSVVKFSPKGGGIHLGSPGEYVTGYGDQKAEARGATWVRAGISPAPGARGVSGCVCLVARCAVDGFGRVFMPDATTCSVRVVDTAANPIIRFGEYGNMDSQGPGSAIPEPEIPFAWPMYAAVSDEAVYVSDMINRRIVRVRLDCAAEESCPVR